MSAFDDLLEERIKSIRADLLECRSKQKMPEDPDKVGCYVALSLDEKKEWIVAGSIEEFKQLAVERRGTNPEEDFWDDANLICPEDHCRILDMDSLKRCVNENGHDTFHLVGPDARTTDDMSMDVEWMADLYEELTKDGTEIDKKLRYWARNRRRELESLYSTYFAPLASKLKKDPDEVIGVKNKIFAHLKPERSSSESDADSSF